MKAKKYKKPRFRNSVLFFCYLAGGLDRWFKRNKGEVEDAAFIARRIAAFTDYTATRIRLNISVIVFERELTSLPTTAKFQKQTA